MKFENVKVGTKVRVKTKMNDDVTPFFRRHLDTVGTVIESPDSGVDVKVEFSDGSIDIGHYSNLKRIKEKHS